VLTGQASHSGFRRDASTPAYQSTDDSGKRGDDKRIEDSRKTDDDDGTAGVPTRKR
jgi:hypothetical protein